VISEKPRISREMSSAMIEKPSIFLGPTLSVRPPKKSCESVMSMRNKLTVHVAGTSSRPTFLFINGTRMVSTPKYAIPSKMLITFKPMISLGA